MRTFIRKQYHWFVMASCCLMATVSVGFFANAYGVFYTPLASLLGIGRGAVAVHATIAGLITGLSGPLVNRLFRRIRLQYVIAFGIVLLAASMLALGTVSSVAALNVIGVIRGIGAACYYIPVLTVIVGNWFHKRFATISGVVLSCSGLAGAILSPVLANLIEAVGLQKTTWISVVFIVVFSLPGVIFCRFRPEEAGLAAYGDERRTAAEPLRTSGEPAKTGTRKTGLILCAVGFLAIATTAVPQHFSSFSTSVGLESSVGIAMMSAAMAGNILFKLLNGVLSDVIGAVRASTIFALVALVCLVVLYTEPRKAAVLIACAFFFGTAYSFGTVGLAAVSRALYGENNGAIYSLVSALGVTSASLSLTGIGTLYDRTGHYRTAFLIAAAFSAASILGMVLLGTEEKRRDRTGSGKP